MTAGAWAVGVLLIAVELGRSVPALRRVVSRRSSDAVSPESIAVLAGFGIGWVLLAWLLSAWMVLIATTLWLAFHILLCRAVWYVSPDKRKRIVRTFFVSVLLLAALTFVLQPSFGLNTSLGIVLGVATLLHSVPALVEGLASRTTLGLSIQALTINTMEGIIYLVIGAGWITIAAEPGGIVGYTLYGVVSVLCNAPRLIRVVYRRLLKFE